VSHIDAVKIETTWQRSLRRIAANIAKLPELLSQDRGSFVIPQGWGTMSRTLVVFCALTLAGCGAAKVDPRAYAHAKYQSADDEYRACINDNLKNVEKCEGKLVQMEANERAYNNVAAGITHGGNVPPRSTAGVTQGAKGTSALGQKRTSDVLPSRGWA
jgi:hypothetical protein